MSKANNLTDFLTGVANAIRTKKGTTDPINAQNYEDEILSISGGGLTGFEEVSGLAGEDLTKNDVVGYFNGDPAVEILPNRSYYDNGNKYYSGGVFYNSSDDSVIETRTIPSDMKIIENFASPTKDYVYKCDSTNNLGIFYKWNGEEYTPFAEISINYPGYYNACETKDYLIWHDYPGTYGKKSNIHIISKADKTLNTLESTSIGANFITIVDYDKNLCYLAYRNATSSSSGAVSITINKVHLEYQDISNIHTSSSKGSIYAIIISENGQAYSIVLYNSSDKYYYVETKNVYGNSYVVKVYNDNTTRFVSASKDFNEIIYYASDKNYLVNVKEQTLTEISTLPTYSSYYNSANNRCAPTIYKQNAIFQITAYNGTAGSYAKILGWGEQYKKITKLATSNVEHIGIVKDDCLQGNNVNVYKVLNYGMYIEPETPETPETNITDLTGKTITFNTSLTNSEDKTYTINFTTGSETFTELRIIAGQNISYYSSSSGEAPVYENGVWVGEEYKTIQVSGGTDATNTELISIIQQIATIN